MGKIAKYFLLLTCVVLLSSMALHKFYMAVFQMEYVPAKKVVQMTSRIFIDDLEIALVKKYNKKFYLGTPTEIDGADEYLKQYLIEKIKIRINGKEGSIAYLGKETEDDVLICYYTIPAKGDIKSIEVGNTTLFEMFPDQQNIIHTKINSNKKSLLLTNDNPKGLLKF